MAPTSEQPASELSPDRDGGRTRGKAFSMAQAAPTSSAPFGVYSEVGQLRKVMVCSQGRAHQRLTPSNCDTLLFDDVLWVDNAKRNHFVQIGPRLDFAF